MGITRRKKLSKMKLVVIAFAALCLTLAVTSAEEDKEAGSGDVLRLSTDHRRRWCRRRYSCGYRVGYRVGHRVGYRRGYRVGYRVRYRKGYRVGYRNGYRVGYRRGYIVGKRVVLKHKKFIVNHHYGDQNAADRAEAEEKMQEQLTSDHASDDDSIQDYDESLLDDQLVDEE